MDTSNDIEFASHIGQDNWVVDVFLNNRGGYFLDFGAFDGIEISNTLTLERDLGWSGICVEPNPSFFPKLCKTRTAICINAALWPRSGEVIDLVDAHGLSSIASFKNADRNAERRQIATKRVVKVPTVNPNDLLKRFNAPDTIEYVSLDTEGCELDILKAMDFRAYRFLLLTIEHNHEEEKQRAIREYLSPLGYGVVQNKNDDFFYFKDFAYSADPRIAAIQIEKTFPIRV